MMDTLTQVERLIELAIIQRSELRRLVEELPQLKAHLSEEIERTFEETEPQLRAELEEWTTKQTADKTAALGVALEAKIADLAKSLEVSTQARYNAIIAEREENARLAAQAEAKIAEHAASLPSAVKEIVSAELARFPRAGEIDQLRKEFAEPRGLNPRGKWQAGETYNKLDLVTINGDSYTSNTDGNRTRPSRSSADWTLVAARGTGGGGGPTSLSELTTVPSDGDLLIGSGTSWVTSNLTAGAGISITVGPGAITISATDGDITLDDGTAASPSLHFTNDPDTGIYRPAANTLGISVSGTQVAYFDENGLTIPNAGVVAGGSFHGANGNANNPSFSFTSDQDTGFYRHGTNELGISIGGTEKAVMTSTTFTITPNLVVSGTGSINGTTIPASKTLVVTTDKLSALASTSSSELSGVISDETGTGSLVFANTPTLVTPILGTPQSGTLTNCTGLPVSTGVSGLGTNVATFLATPSSANLASAVTDETGTGALVFANTPTLVTPVIGAATGTSLTVTGNVTSADSILGASGPSVKSSLSARAPRQGLVFDGTAGATVSSVPALGTTWTIAFWCNPTSFAANRHILSSASQNQLYVSGTTGVLQTESGFGTGITLVAGKTQLVVVSCSAGTATGYLNGIASSPFTESASFGAPTVIGQYAGGGGGYWVGNLSVLIYNRALSASEVVSLYESGAPAGADYNSASNTALNNSTFLNIDFTTFTSASSTGFTATNTSGAFKYAKSAGVFSIATGQRFRVRYTLSGTFTNLRVELAEAGVAGKSAFATLSAGTNEVTLVATGATANGVLQIYSNGSADNFTLSNVTIDRPGLLLAPDAAQAGGGLVWYDTSGNAANITLPASGVSWNVPTSGYWGGNLNVSGTGTSSVAGNLGIGTTNPQSKLHVQGTQIRWTSSATSTDPGILFLTSANTYAEIRAGQNGDFAQAKALVINNNGGNLLIGTTTDSGQKLQVNGDIAVGSGNPFSNAATKFSFTSSTNYAALAIAGGAGTGSQIDIGDGAIRRAIITGEIDSSGNKGKLIFRTNAGSSATSASDALTLDSSQNATFAGKVQVGTSSVTGAQLVVVGPASASARTAIIRSVTAGDTSYSAGLFSKYDNNSTTSQVFVQFSINNDGTASGQINANGASQAAFGSWSDARLKKNIVSLGSQWNAIKSLRPVEFDYIESEGGGHQIGFIAQEVQPIYSDVVGTRPDGMFTLSGMGKNEARLIKALQEAMLRIEALEAKLA